MPPPNSNRDSPRSANNWITTHSGNVFYRPCTSARKLHSAAAARFPRPLIEPRRTRPHAIHIVTYPPGYVPPELRQRPGPSSRSRSFKVRAAKAKRRISSARVSSSPQAPEQQQQPSQPSQEPTPPSDTQAHQDQSLTPSLSQTLGTGTESTESTTTSTTVSPPQSTRPRSTTTVASASSDSSRHPYLTKLLASLQNNKSHPYRRHSVPALPDAPVIDRPPATGVPSMTSLPADTATAAGAAGTATITGATGSTTATATAAATTPATNTSPSGPSTGSSTGTTSPRAASTTAPTSAHSADTVSSTAGTAAATIPAEAVPATAPITAAPSSAAPAPNTHHHSPSSAQPAVAQSALQRSLSLISRRRHSRSPPSSADNGSTTNNGSSTPATTAPAPAAVATPSSTSSQASTPATASSLSSASNSTTTSATNSAAASAINLAGVDSPTQTTSTTPSRTTSTTRVNTPAPPAASASAASAPSPPPSTTTPATTTASDHTGPPTAPAATPAPAPPPTQLRSRPRHGSSISLAAKRNSLMSIRPGKPSLSSLVSEAPRSVASGSGVSCSILLAEPNVFLSGFDHDGHARRETRAGTALLRGKLQLNVTKNVKLKAVQLKLLGRARTEWPEGIPPLKQDVYEEQGLRTQVLTFFNAMNDGWETEYGNQCTYKLKDPQEPAAKQQPASTYLVVDPIPAARKSLTPRDLKRLSLQSAQSRSFGKGDNVNTTSTQAKGFKIFHPGRYDYSFELPIDHHQLETTKLQYGSVKWELHATIDRAGTFKPNLHGSVEVPIIRIPDQMSLEMSEPISISRQWEDQLHYDIVISGKSFPIGGKIPIAFKLTPLAKVQVHKLKVFATETVEYWTNDRRVTRKDPGRKILLLEKSAGKPLDRAWASSDLRTVRGGELSNGQRHEARALAARRRELDAARGRHEPQPLPPPSENLLGDLDLGLESYWGSTEIEANVQIPTCEMMAKNKELRLHPDCSWKNVNVYHWLKIVMRISRQDPGDPTGNKRRHFEISIDSPFTVLNCRATQANTILPAYSGNQAQGQTYQSSCGCPDATTVAAGVSPSSSTGTLSGAEMAARGASREALPSIPQAAHVHGTTANPANEMAGRNGSTTSIANNEPRPIHLLRTPSFNPPAFDEDTAPPPMANSSRDSTINDAPSLMTPPPQYDHVIGTPSVDGMADYFSRLAEHGYENQDDSEGSDSDETPPRILERSGRVNVAHPRTPGGRMQSRSMEIARPAINLHLDRPTNAANWAVPSYKNL